MEKALLDIKELKRYIGVSDTKLRELLKEHDWGLKIGNKWYAHKKKLDKWLESQTSY